MTSSVRQPSTAPTAEALIESLSHAEVLEVPNPSPSVRAAYRRVIWQAKESGLVDQSQVLRHTGRNRGDLRVWLEDRVTGRDPSDATPDVPVPATLRGAHPTVIATREQLARRKRDDQGRFSTFKANGAFHLRVSEAAVNRALRILQAVSTAVDLPVEAPTGYRSRANVGFTVDGHTHPFRLVELMDRHVHELTSAERRHLERNSWWRAPEYDYEPTGKLKIELEYGYGGTRRSWSDGKRASLEEKLGSFVDELRARSRADEERQREREEAERQRQREYHERLERARRQMVESATAAHLMHQADAWERADKVRRYCDALEETAERRPLPPETAQWLEWARAYAKRTDPTHAHEAPTAPQLSEVTDHEVLQWLHAGGARQMNGR